MNRNWLLATLLAFAQTIYWTNLPAYATWVPYNWLITIKTERLDNQFNYSGSNLRPVVKGSVSYSAIDGSTTDTKYENLWFCQGKPYGLERSGQLAIPAGDGVAIQVLHATNNATQDELKAAADSILRILIDAQINQNIIHTVIVPASSFPGICQALQMQHFVPSADAIDTPHLAGAYLFLMDDADNQRQSLKYSP